MSLRDTVINPIPAGKEPARPGCWSFGPDKVDNRVDKQINEFLDGKGGWIILNLHGLDEEGRGTVSFMFLTDHLKRLVKLDYLDKLPAGLVLTENAM